MNTTDLMIFMVSMAVCMGAVALLGYFAFRSIISSRRTARNPPSRPQFERRVRAFPGIICALPMHQVKRAEAPMTDIWSR
jgi:hypothetical protein